MAVKDILVVGVCVLGILGIGGGGRRSTMLTNCCQLFICIILTKVMSTITYNIKNFV